MATRLYFLKDQPAFVSPAFDGTWTVTGSALRRAMSLTKLAGDAPALSGGVAMGAGQHGLDRQYVSPPLNGAQVLNFQVNAFLACMSSNTNTYMAAVVKLVNNDGTVWKGDLLNWSFWGPGGTPYAPVGAAAARNFIRPSVAAVIAAADGDRIVVELGFSCFLTGARTGFGEYGADSALGDYVAEYTTGLDPWIEFDQNLIFGSDDTDPPVVSSEVPANGATEVALDAAMGFDVTDPGSGVDLATVVVVVTVDPGGPGESIETAYDGGAGGYQAGYSGSANVIADGFQFAFNRAAAFPENTTVQVAVDADDNVGNSIP